VHRLEITRLARKQIDRLPAAIASRVTSAIQSLARDPRPRGCVKLEGRADTWRIRVSDYRVVYEVRDKALVVIVIRVAYRRDVYRGR
jgi:mRNA interferase RelE/StbE